MGEEMLPWQENFRCFGESCLLLTREDWLDCCRNTQQGLNVSSKEGNTTHLRLCAVCGYCAEEDTNNGTGTPSIAFTGGYWLYQWWLKGEEVVLWLYIVLHHHSRKIRWITLPFSNYQHHPNHRAWWSRRAIIIFMSAQNGLEGGRVARNPSTCCHNEFQTCMCTLLPIWMRLKIIFSIFSLSKLKLIEK